MATLTPLQMFAKAHQAIKLHGHAVFTVAHTSPRVQIYSSRACVRSSHFRPNGLLYNTAAPYFSLLMGTRTTTQSHRQPVKLFKGSANVIPQLYQSHRQAQCFITDEEGQTQREGLEMRGGGLWPWPIDIMALLALVIYYTGEPRGKRGALWQSWGGQGRVFFFLKLHVRCGWRSKS